MTKAKPRHFLTGEELSQDELLALLYSAEIGRMARKNGRVEPVLKGQTVALVFEKPSLRTRTSFTVGVQELGGYVVEVANANRKSEEPEDTIRVLAGYCHGVMVRTHEQSILDRMAAVSPVPIINGLSDDHHPCQALADLLTLQQSFGELKGLKLAYVGDGNNVLHSLLLLAPFLGVHVTYACPEGHGPNEEILARARLKATVGGGSIQGFTDPAEAVKNANAVYTDTWVSMGFESKDPAAALGRIQLFTPYQVNEKLYSGTAPGALIMHCMPMVRNQEITDAMVEHEHSALFRQSENRLHVQKALMIELLAWDGAMTEDSLPMPPLNPVPNTDQRAIV